MAATDLLAFIHHREVSHFLVLDFQKVINSSHLPNVARAYALQCRTPVKILKSTVPLPKVFDSDNPRLLYGFVALANLFHAIDNTFMAFWSCADKDKRACSGSWLKNLQYNVDISTLLVSESMETQRLDISVSRLWLHVLLWQMGVTCGLVALDASDQCMNLSYPIKLAKELVTITSKADQNCLNSHGIGMVSLHFFVNCQYLLKYAPN